MPGACVYCHGGTLRPLRADGTFRDNTLNGTAGNGINGDTNAKLQLLEVPSLEYGDYSPYTKAEQEPIIKQVNQAIYCTYPNLPAAGIQAACAQFCVDPTDTTDCDGAGTDILDIFDTTTGSGEWNGSFAREMSEGWYDDESIAGSFDRETYNDEFVPPAWRHDSSDNVPPAGSEQLFLEVVQPVCFVCHSRRGSDLGSNTSLGVNKDIDFSTYERFISHADQIKLYVYDRGVMPLSLRGYNAFWDEDSDAPEILAAHLNGVLAADNQIPFNGNEVDEPGAAIADAGPDRTSTSPLRLFGSNSRYVDTYQWSISSEPVGSDAVLTDASTSRPLLTTSVDGDYEITLTASFDGSQSTDSVRIKIDNGLNDLTVPQDPKTITFDDIKGVLSDPQDAANSSETDVKSCDECHQDAAGGGAIAGVPVYWRDAQPTTGDTATNAFYLEILSRVDFKDPAANRQNYDLFLNWIMEGAPEN